MTRFMMTLEDAVDLVIYAFEHGNQGDLFVQKAPSVTIDILAKAVKSLKKSKVDIKYIGSQLAPHWIYKNFKIYLFAPLYALADASLVCYNIKKA